MGRKLLNDEDGSSLFSPLIDVVFNALAAMFIIFMIYAVVFRPSDCDDDCEPIRFDKCSAIDGLYLKSFTFYLPTYGGTSNRSYKILSGSLPEGLNLDTTRGFIYGIPKIPMKLDKGKKKIYKATFRVEDNVSYDEREFVFQFGADYITFQPYLGDFRILRESTILPNAIENENYEEAIGVLGGIGPYNWQITSGRLPNGLELVNGRIYGQPTEVGSFDFVIKVVDNSNKLETITKSYFWSYQETTKQFSLTVAPQTHLTASVHFNDYYRVNELIEGVIQSNKNLEEINVNISKHNSDLSLSFENGIIKGISNKPGEYIINLNIFNISDSVLVSDKIIVIPVKPSKELPRIDLFAKVNQEINFFLPYQGFTEPVLWQLNEVDQLPAGLSLVNNRIVGIPSQIGEYEIPLSFENAFGDKQSNTINIIIEDVEPLKIETSQLAKAQIGKPFDFKFSATGGNGKYQWDFVGDLPTGLKYTETGISGIPNTPLKSNVEVKLLNNNQTITSEYLLETFYLDSSNIEIITNKLPTITKGIPIEFAFSASGGIGYYTWQFEGDLPTGLDYTSNGFRGNVDSTVLKNEWVIRAEVKDETSIKSSIKEFKLVLIDSINNDKSDLIRYLKENNIITYVILAILLIIFLLASIYSYGIKKIFDKDFIQKHFSQKKIILISYMGNILFIMSILLMTFLTIGFVIMVILN